MRVETSRKPVNSVADETLITPSESFPSAPKYERFHDRGCSAWRRKFSLFYKELFIESQDSETREMIGIFTNGDDGKRQLLVHHYILLVICIVIVAIVTLSITLTVRLKHPKPNVVLIVADDMGYNDIGYYNQHNDIRTPVLDSLSQEGMRLDRYYALAVCTPARAALFTGRYPFRYGMQGSRPIQYGTKAGLPESEDHLLPQVMKEAGYKTYLVGKWHLGFSKWIYTPITRGYDYFYGMYGGFADYFTHESAEPESDNKVFDLHEHELGEDGEIVVRSTKDKAKLIDATYNVYSETIFTEKAVEIIEDHDQKDPLFLTVCYMNPHSPLQALDEDLARVPKHVDNEIRRNFSALMSSLDYGVEGIVSALKMKGMYEETIIIFTGDNGGAVQGPVTSHSLGGTNYPYRGGKWTNWEGGVRVPAFIVGPGIPKNVSSDALFHITDWLPTLAKIVNVKPKKELDGVDQTDLLLHSGSSARSDIILELDPMVHQAAIVKGNYKLIVGPAGSKPYNDIYEPLNGSAVFYKGMYTKQYKEFSDAVTQLQHQYEEASSKSDYNINDMNNVGEFSATVVSLYNLNHDPSESHDLFTDTGRFRNIARELYDVLKEKAENEMVKLILYGQSDGKYKDSTHSFEEIQLDNGETMNKWYPWLDANKK